MNKIETAARRSQLPASLLAAVRALRDQVCHRCGKAEALVADGGGRAFCESCHRAHLADARAAREAQGEGFERLALAKRRLARATLDEIGRVTS